MILEHSSEVTAKSQPLVQANVVTVVTEEANPVCQCELSVSIHRGYHVFHPRSPRTRSSRSTQKTFNPLLPLLHFVMPVVYFTTIV